ncbi:MAG: trypsin-like serine protease [Myxococcales bacterium]|nr:trypsin-like serine protease [Myxococcota bacterium]MDW8280942.1 trypsin-like serine protease [Myxococcales bacterium]
MKDTRTWLTWLLGASLLGLGACGSPGNLGPDEIGASQEAIIGGTPTTGDPAIVALYAQRPGQEGGSLCTAEIIAPTVVLTAAHCVHPELVGPDAQFSVLTAANIIDPMNPSPRLAVREVHYHPRFRRTALTEGFDIAVVILDQPTTIPPLPINRDPLPPTLQGQQIRIVGYGLNQALPPGGAGIKRTANTTLNGFDNKFVRTGDWFRRICSGDSGGPVLARLGGVEKIIGVNSFGFIFCLFEGYSTRVDSYLSFIDTYLR